MSKTWQLKSNYNGRIMHEITAYERIADGLSAIKYLCYTSGEGGLNMWASVKARKHGKCAATGEEYGPGEAVYRPVGNMRYRSLRIKSVHIDVALKEGNSKTGI